MGDIAIVHMDLRVRGGGEHVALQLADLFDAPLYVGYAPDDVASTVDADVRELFTGRLSRRLIESGGITRSLAYQVLWQQDTDELTNYDVLILSGNEPLWYVPTDTQVVIAYTHSPPRYAYDLFHDYGNSLGDRYAQLYEYFKRVVYDHNVRRPEMFVANSDLIARRIRRYWGIDRGKISVVYPPVDVDTYSHTAADTEEYYFTMSRLDQTKRIDQIVRAFVGTERRLVVAGDGGEYDRLRALAAGHENVTFVGYITEEEKRRRLAEASAFVFNARNEDFGLVTVEAMASGTPVIGVDEGFTGYQILDGKNGYTFLRGVDQLRDAIDTFEREGVDWDEAHIEAFAEQFSTSNFADGMEDVVERARAEAEIVPPWTETY